MKNKVPLPVIIIAVIGIVAVLVFMGRSYMEPPGAVHTAPPSFIDPATGRPKEQMHGSSQTVPSTHVGGPPPAGAPGGQ